SVHGRAVPCGLSAMRQGSRNRSLRHAPPNRATRPRILPQAAGSRQQPAGRSAIVSRSPPRPAVTAGMKQQTPDNVYVLSPLQQGLLFHSLQSPDAGLYVDQTVLTLQGEILPDLLAQALRHVCSRHGALRTT